MEKGREGAGSGDPKIDNKKNKVDGASDSKMISIDRAVGECLGLRPELISV
jgi:hypothetical protein